jgi:hypothetical protein
MPGYFLGTTLATADDRVATMNGPLSKQVLRLGTDRGMLEDHSSWCDIQFAPSISSLPHLGSAHKGLAPEDSSSDQERCAATSAWPRDNPPSPAGTSR